MNRHFGPLSVVAVTPFGGSATVIRDLGSVSPQLPVS